MVGVLGSNPSVDTQRRKVKGLFQGETGLLLYLTALLLLAKSLLYIVRLTGLALGFAAFTKRSD